eukprot:356090_1
MHSNHDAAFDHIDFDLFKMQQNREKCIEHHRECPSLRRICFGLKLYSSSSNIDKLISFQQKIYNVFLDDYIHFVQKHTTNQELIQIADAISNTHQIKQCDVSTCSVTLRHYQTDGDFADAKTQINENEVNRHKSHNDIDFEFAARRNLIQSERKNNKLSNLHRYEESNKYNLNVAPLYFDTESKEAENTFLDLVYSKIETDVDIQNDQVAKLQKYLSQNQHDSDSLKNDLNDLDHSNISNYIQCQVTMQTIKNFIRFVQLSSSSFSTGFHFFYWDKFKNDTNGECEDRLNGYTYSELFVSARFASLKIEILQSGYLSIQNWNAKVIAKAEGYYSTQRVKKTKAEYNFYDHITIGCHISIKHLMSIILYCDWSDLSTDFTGTFRRNSFLETLESVKERHSNYLHFAKLLVEAVTSFGINGDETNPENYLMAIKMSGFELGLSEKEMDFQRQQLPSQALEYEYGPFFCGLSAVLNIPSFAIYLKGPCSTSKVIEIAMNFSKRDGIIIELQNNDDYGSKQQPFFDCSWISKYGEENERLFIAGRRRLRLASIRIIETTENFEKYLNVFYAFDGMLSYMPCVPNYYLDSSHFRILDRLISNKLNETITFQFHQYIVDIFDLFLLTKTQVTFHMSSICDFDKKLKGFSGLFFDRLVKNENKEYVDIDQSSNILKGEILSIFPNLSLVYIVLSHAYKFHLSSFLSSINSCKSSIKFKIRNDMGDPPPSNFKLWIESALKIMKGNDLKSHKCCMDNFGDWFIIGH